MLSSGRIAVQDRIPLFQKLMFATGQNMEYVSTGLMTGVLWMPFFNIGLGLSPIVLGIVLMILRAWDAITNPIMGNISDNARTRWGRRRPFMVVGAITTALLYPLIWHMPESVYAGTSWMAAAVDWIPFLDNAALPPADKAMSVYLTLVGMVFFASFTIWSMPYYGMQLELTPSYDERTRLAAWMTFFGKLSSLIGGWMLAVVLLAGSLALGDPKVLKGKPEFVRDMLSAIQPWLVGLANPHQGEKPIVVGMRVLCWVIAAGILCFGLLPALFVKERYYEKESSKQPHDPFWRSIRETVRCTPLWSLISVSFFLVLGSTSVGSLGQYVNFFYVCDGDLSRATVISGLKGSVLVVTGIASLPMFTWLGEKFDKQTVVLMMLTSSMCGHLLNYFLMTPEHPYWQLIPGVFESSAIAAVWLFLPSMKADVADWDEQHTARRREGAINAFYSWFIKASLTASMGIGGAVLQFSGFKAGLEHQPREVLDRMFHVYLVLPIVAWTVALVSIWFYPLTRVRSAEIRVALEKRRGAL
jgi:GPH family glycoside/pentoside/hexuronide:cation symporter